MACLSASALQAQVPEDPPPVDGMPRYFAPTYRSSMGAPLPFAIGLESLPRTIPADGTAADPSGRVGFHSATGAVSTDRVTGNAFFRSTGTNGRSCGTCHNPAQGMSISVTDIRKRFQRSGIKDPLFAAVDGADCPNLVPASETKPSRYYGRRIGRGRDSARARSLLLKDGLIRVFLPVPATREFTIEVTSDPTTCNKDPLFAFDPTVPEAERTENNRIISVFRRPLISANLDFKTKLFPGGTNIMWDGRDPNLHIQAEGAVLVHSQRDTRPPPVGQGQVPAADIDEMVAFQENFFVAQQSDRRAGPLDADGATGGPLKLKANIAAALADTIPPGALAPPAEPPGTRPVHRFPFDEYTAWAGNSNAKRASIQRGQDLFDGTNPRGQFRIANVPNFNNVAVNDNPAPGETCAGCHHAFHGGSSFVAGGVRNIGVNGDFAEGFGDDGGGGGTDQAAPLRTDLPIFTLTCATTPRFRKSNVIKTNDPGRALITGRCADIGGTTIPQLRALNSHLPLFHDGSANTVRDVVEFYDRRFSMGLTRLEKTDLTNFLEAL